MNNKPYASPFWLVAFIAFSVLLLFQSFYTWSNDESVSADAVSLPENKTIFLTFEETSFGTKKRGFDTLFNSLETYQYDKEKGIVWIKPVETASKLNEGGTKATQLPRSNTQVMAIYDKGFDSFQKREDILSISTFPYEYLQNDEPFFEVRSIDREGNAYLTFRGKRLKLDANSSYPAVWFEGLRLKSMIIKNHGILDHSQFKEFETNKK